MADLDVLVPHYNSPQDLEMSLQSIAEQTWSGEIRVVVVDDGSVAGHLAEAERIIAESPLLIDFRKSDKNCGRPVTRNKLLDAIESPLVSWLDAGDTWYPEKTEIQVKSLQETLESGADPRTVWITCTYDWKRVGVEKYAVAQDTSEDQIKALFIGDRLRAYLWTLLAPREAFETAGRFDERLPRLQDLDFFLSFTRAGGRLVTPDISLFDDALRAAHEEGKAFPVATPPLCCYFKDDVGRDARQIRKCNAVVFEKHKPALSKYGRRFMNQARFKADIVAARFARFNGERLLSFGYKTRAMMTSPRYAAYKVKRKLTGA